MIAAELLQILTTTAEWLLMASLKTIPLIVFVLIIQRLFRKQLSAAAHYWLWMGVLISLTLPLGWDLPLSENSRPLPMATI